MTSYKNNKLLSTATKMHSYLLAGRILLFAELAPDPKKKA